MITEHYMAHSAEQIAKFKTVHSTIFDRLENLFWFELDYLIFDSPTSVSSRILSLWIEKDLIQYLLMAH